MKFEMDMLINRDAPRPHDVNMIFKGQVGGIKTDLFAIEKYVDEVLDEIKSK